MKKSVSFNEDLYSDSDGTGLLSNIDNDDDHFSLTTSGGVATVPALATDIQHLETDRTTVKLKISPVT